MYMFTKVRLQNFRSFKDITFDLSDTKNKYKNFAMVYGENGVGKSNLISGFEALIHLMRTMDIRDALDKLLLSEKLRVLLESSGDSDVLLTKITSGFRDAESLSQQFRTVDCDEPMSIEYEFIINNKKGSYLVEIEKEIIHERLEYVLEKNKGVYFDITPERQKINDKVFENVQALAKTKELMEQYWGKHTLLAILFHEKNDKSERYMSKALSDNFLHLISQFLSVSCLNKTGDGERGSLLASDQLMTNLEGGTISKSQEQKLDAAAQMLTELFHSINSDNRKLFYKKAMIDDNKIKYKLFLTKYIAGRERDIDFTLESTGNHQILHILPFLLLAMQGNVVFVDELDSGIHDLLIKEIIESALPVIKANNGQLVITSHNTYLMEMSDARSSVYIIKDDDSGNRIVQCIDNSGKGRIYEQNSIRNQYIHGKYEGIPNKFNIDIHKIINFLNNN